MRSVKVLLGIHLLQVIAIAPMGSAALGNEISALCEEAAQRAAQRHGIPEHLLQTLTLTETGRQMAGVLRPWPWAINHSGTGHWFASQAEMMAFAEELLATGRTNFDIGCFQLNYRWHQQQFASLDDMATPISNANYAAWFLRTKFNEAGSWRSAVGAYHSQTPAYAESYLARFETVFAQSAVSENREPAAEAAQPAPGRPSPNDFPLLVRGASAGNASLVPLLGPRDRLIGASE